MGVFGTFFDVICVVFECWLCLSPLFSTLATKDADAHVHRHADSGGYDGNIAGAI
jgi:hypothetical protein